MATRHIDRHAWAAELDSFSRRHDGWIVTVRVAPRHGMADVIAEDVPLRGIDLVGPRRGDLIVSVGNGREHFAHQIKGAAAVSIDETAAGVERALVIDGPQESTIVEFRSPMRPEEVDGLVPHE
jgi:hypothetical protein